MPNALVCRNPFRPQLDREVVSVRAGTRLDTFLRKQGLISGRGRSLIRTSVYIVQVNGEYLLQAQWTRRVESDDVVVVTLLPGNGGGGSNPLQVVLMVALVAASIYAPYLAGLTTAVNGVTSVTAAGSFLSAGIMIGGGLLMNALLPPPKAASTAAREQASPNYTIGAQGNTARLMEAIPSLYGRYRLYPDFAAEPYSEIDSNEQYVYQLFCVTQGHIAIEQILIEDNPISSFAEVRYEVVPPGGRVTLFPDNVATVAAVQNLELKGPNEVGHEVLGPFVANPANTKANTIGIDISFPQGLFRVNNENKLREVSVSWRFEAQQVDDSGAPIGGWFILADEVFKAATQTPQMRTYRYGVPEGRYQVRGVRLSEKFTEMSYANALQWVGMRAYLPGTQEYGNVTMLAVAIRGSNNINQQTARRINVIGTRMLQTWDPVQGWSVSPVATRSPAWAIADVFRNREYGRGLPDSRQNLFALYQLDQEWAARGDYFDGVFDTTITVWEAATRIARVGRAIPMYYAGVIEVVRNGPRTVRRAMYQPMNIVADSFSIERSYHAFDSPDHVIVEFTNAATWQPDEVVCVLPGGTVNRPFRVSLPGVTSRDQAWREGMSMAAANRDQRKLISFKTELDGHIPGYLDLVQVSHDVPAWGMSGYIVERIGNSNVLRTSDALTWYPGQNHYVALRRLDGSADGPYRVTAGPDEYSMVLAGTPNVYISEGVDEEPTYYQFGPGERRGLAAQVRQVIPDESGLLTLELVNYAESVHSAELGGAVPPPSPGSLLPLTPNAPVVDEVTVYAASEPGFQIVSATPARGATTYEFEASNSEGAAWMFLGSSDRPSLRSQLPPGVWWVRARGVGAMPGPWKMWQGLVTATMAPPPSLELFTATSLLFGIQLDWILPAVPWLKSIELMYSDTPRLGDARPLGAFAVPVKGHTMLGLRAGQVFYFWARIRDEGGNPGPWTPLGEGLKGESSSDASAILEYIAGKIDETLLSNALRSRIERIGLDLLRFEAEQGINDGAISDLLNADKALIATLSTEVRDRIAQYQGIVNEMNGLAGQISAANAAILAETNARIAAVNTVTSNLAAETSARIAAVSGVVANAAAMATDIQTVNRAVMKEVADRIADVHGLEAAVSARVSTIETEMAGLLGTESYDPEKQYALGNLVKNGGKLYRAKQAVKGVAPPNGTYWELVGQYDSLGAAVADLASRSTALELVTESQATKIGTLESTSATSSAKIESLQQTTATQATRLDQLGAKTDAQAASISSLQDVTGAQATQINTLRADINGQGTSITTLNSVTAALATRTTTLEGRSDALDGDVGAAKAQLMSLQQASDSAAFQLLQLTAEAGNSDAELVRIEKVTADQAIVIERMRVSDGVFASQIESIQTIQAGQASQLTTLSTTVGGQGTLITNLQTTTATQATALATLTARTAAAESNVTRLDGVTATQAQTIATLGTTVGGNTNAITAIQTTNAQMAERVTGLESSSNAGSAAITELQRVQGSHATALSTLTTKVDGHTTSIQTLNQTTETQAQQYTALAAEVSGNTGSISRLDTVTAGHTQSITALSNRTGGIESSITAINATTAAQAQRLTNVETKATDALSRVQTLEQTDALSALRFLQLESELGGYDASITDLYETSEGQARTLLVVKVAGEQATSAVTELRAVTADSAARLATVETKTTALTNRTTSLEETSATQATRIGLVESLAGNTKTAVETLTQTTATLAVDVTTLKASDETQNASIVDLRKVQADLAYLALQLQAEAGNADASFVEIHEIQAGAARRESVLIARTDDNTASIRTLAQTVTTETTALATELTNLTARVSGAEAAGSSNTAAISAEATARASAVDALAQRVDTAYTRIGENIVVKNTAIGAARVAIRLIQGAVTTEIAGPDLLDEGGSYRYRLPLITLAGTDKLQANVLGGVDATVGLQVMGT